MKMDIFGVFEKQAKLKPRLSTSKMVVREERTARVMDRGLELFIVSMSEEEKEMLR